MKKFTSIALIGLIAVASVTFAQDKTAAPMDHSKMKGMEKSTAEMKATDMKGMNHSAMVKPPQLNIAANAKEAVLTVDRFSKALSAGRLDKAGAELDANVLILESGGAETSAAEYLGGHAIGDAAFLKGMHVQLVRRTAQANGEMAWVGSESELHNMKDGKMATILSTETMVLKRTDKTWKISHIHWSSRAKKPGSH